MREIKFRGRAIDSGEWVYGHLLLTDGRAYIHPIRDGLDFEDSDFGYGFVQVDPKTAGQFTGLLDKNGNEWYHNDILFDGKRYYRIDWSEESLSWILSNPNMRGVVQLADINSRLWSLAGNIHENQELLGA